MAANTEKIIAEIIKYLELDNPVTLQCPDPAFEEDEFMDFDFGDIEEEEFMPKDRSRAIRRANAKKHRKYKIEYCEV